MNSMFRKIIAYVLVFTMALTMNVNVFAAADVVAQTEPTATVEDVHEHEHSEDGTCLVDEEESTEPTTAGEEEVVTKDSEDGTETEPSSEPVMMMSTGDETDDATVPAAQSDDGIIDSGTCGEKATWSLSDDGILTISGTGAMNDYTTLDRAPWYQYKSEMKSLVIEDGITEIGDYAFYYCTALTGELVIPESVISIGIFAFSWCSGFTGDLIIPDSVKEIGGGAFNDCTGFDGILTLSKNLTEIKSTTFQKCSNLSGTLIIPEGVTEIGVQAFDKCGGFTGVELPESLKIVNSLAFDYNYFTGTIIVGKNVEAFEPGYFCRSVDLKIYNPNCTFGSMDQNDDYPITIWGYENSNAQRFAEQYGFEFKTLLVASGECGENLTWSLDKAGTLTISGTGAMYDYTIEDTAPWDQYKSEIKSLMIEDGITEIGDRAFYDCTGLTGELVIPESVKTIGRQAFASCSGFEGDLVIPDSVETIGSDAFSGCAGFNGDLTLSKNLTKIELGTFNGCYNLTGELIIPEGVVEIDNEAFEGCKSFSGISLPESLTVIDSRAFDDCTGLTGNLIIPKSVTKVGNYAFSGCSNLNEITILNNECEIYDSKSTLPMGIKVIGYADSTAKTYAEKYEFAFSHYECIIGTHFYDEGTVTKEPTCVEEGSVDKKCSVCNKVSTEVLPPQTGSHTWNNTYTVDTEPTCTEIGAKSIHCTLCDAVQEGTYMPVESLGHDYSDWNVDKEATCTTVGSQHKTCSRCDDVVTEEIPQLPHPWEELYTTDKEPTCTTEGEKSIHCAVCDARTEITAVKMLPHNYDEWVVESESHRHKTCLDCGHLNTERVSFTSEEYAVEARATMPLDYEIELGTNAPEDVIITTSNKWVATVEDGIVEAHRYGKVTITVQVGGVSDTCIVNVTDSSLVDAGTCGDNVFWSLNDTYDLHIYGSGNMNSNPWNKYSDSIRTLTMEEGIESIASYAFQDCKNIANELDIPESVKYIYHGAFDGCEQLKGTLVLPEGLEYLGSNAFYDCKSLTGDLVIPGSLTRIEIQAFKGCVGLDGNLIIEEGVKEIGHGAFWDCSNLDWYGLPWSLEVIEDYAFDGCSSLSNELTIPDNVKVIGDYAFQYCIGIDSLYFPDGLIEIGDAAFRGCTGLVCSIMLPDNLTTIGGSAFAGCTGLWGDLVIPSSVTEIGSYAFERCTGFTGDLNVPDNVLKLGYGAFRGCTGFDGTLHISNKLTQIENSTFYGCSNITGTLILPEKITKIGEEAFKECSKLTGALTIPQNVKEIGRQAFYNGNGFTGNLTLPIGLEQIGYEAFSGCSNLSGNLIIPYGVKKIEGYAFYDCSGFKGRLELPDSLTSIGACAFYNCSGLIGKLKLPSRITTIEISTFNNCKNLTGDLLIPEGVTTIGYEAFNNCSSLNKTIVIPGSVKKIDDYAFSGCKNIQDVIISDSVTEMDYPFSGMNHATFWVYKDSYAEKYMKESYSDWDIRYLSEEQYVPEEKSYMYMIGGDIGLKEEEVINIKDILFSTEEINVDELQVEIEKKSVIMQDGDELAALFAGTTGITFTYGDLSCTGTITVYDANKDVTPTAITFENDSLYVDKGTTGYNPALLDPNKQNHVKEITWQSENPNIATVDSNGVVRGIESGYTRIRATYGDKVTAVYNLQVGTPVLDLVVPEKYETYTLYKRDTAKIQYLIYPYDATNSEVTFSSSDDNVVSVDSSGRMTANEVGTATITLSADDGEFIRTVAVKVINPLKGISFSKDSFILENMTTADLQLNLDAADAVNVGKIIYSSDSPNVVSVDEKGKVTAKGIGIATITATANGYTAQCKVISPELQLENIYLDESTMAVEYGDMFKLAASRTPYNTTDEYALVWSTNNPAVATVDQDGNVEAVGLGAAEITITEGNFTDSCIITVDKKTPEYKVPDFVCVEVGKTLADADLPEGFEFVEPETVINERGNAVYKATYCPDPDHYQIVEDINITVIGVQPAITGLVLSDTALETNCETDLQLEAVISGQDVFAYNVEWSSSNEDVATVNNKGKITFTGEGETTITAKVTDQYSAECVIVNTHNWNTNYTMDKEATCTEDGLKSIRCIGCDAINYQEVIETYGHTWDKEHTVDKKPTCTESGLQSIHCSSCDAKQHECAIAPKGHDYCEWFVVEEPFNCATPGLERKACMDCGITEERNAVIEHKKLLKYEGWEATCQATGRGTYWQCAKCSAMFADEQGTKEIYEVPVIPMLDHDWGEWYIVSELTCTNDGHKYHYCNDCGTYDEERETAPGHAMVFVDEKAATCTEEGNEEYWTCENCYGYFSDEDGYNRISKPVIQALGHSPLVDEAVAATCTDDGLTEGSHCETCSEVLVAQRVISKLGHEPEIIGPIDPTCTTEGQTEGSYCSRCEEVLIAPEEIPALGHTEVVDKGIEATCTEDGITDGKHCSVCNKVLVAQEIIPATGHKMLYGDEIPATCTQPGSTSGGYCENCDYTVTAGEIPALGHDKVIDEAVDATCTTDGLTEGEHCSRCDEILVEQEVIPAFGHNVVTDAAVEPTCTETGVTEGTHCATCDEVFIPQLEIPALGHDDVIDPAVEPTCTGDGLTVGSHCQTCGEVLIEQETIPALGHEEVIEEGYPETCTEDGLSDGIYCSRCDEILAEQEVLPALGHSMVYSDEIPATCTEDGYSSGGCCENCDYVVEAGVIPALGHSYNEWIVVEPAEFGKAGIERNYCDNGCGEYEECPITIVDSGTAGDNVTWTIDCDKVITFSGTGPITDKSSYYKYNCTYEKIIIEEGITEIPDMAFDNSTSLRAVELADSIERIGNGAFQISGGLTGDIDLPANLKYIGDRAFHETSITGQLVIPEGVTYIGERAFGACKSLSGTLTIPASIKNINAGAFESCMSLDKLVIEDGITSIGSNAFYDCNKLTGDLVIPDSVTSIGSNAFNNCYSFNGTLTLSKNLQGIDYGVFENCSGFTGDLIIPESVTNFGMGNGFANCSGFNGTLKILGDISDLGYGTFYNCSGLKKIEFVGNVLNVSGVAFENCTGLEGPMIFPECVRTVYSYGFDTLPKHLDYIFMNENCTVEGDKVFSIVGKTNSLAQDYANKMGCRFQLLCDYYGNDHTWTEETIITPPTCTESGWAAITCTTCGMPHEVGVPATGHDLYSPVAFIPPTCTEQGCDCYFECKICGKLYTDNSAKIELDSIPYIPATGHSYSDWIVDKAGSCTETGSRHKTCGGCNAVITETFGGAGHSWNDWYVYRAAEFGNAGEERQYCQNCNEYNSREITVMYSGVCGKDAFWTIDVNNVLTISGTGAISDCSGFANHRYDYKKIVIKDGITEICDFCFDGSAVAESVVLPDSIEVIGQWAFTLSNPKMKIDPQLPANLKQIGAHAFYGAPFKDGQLIIPEGVTSIGEAAFYNCTGINGELVIPGTIKTINKNTFFGCTGITSIVLEEGIEFIDEYALAVGNKDAVFEKIVLPESLKETYVSFGDMSFETLVVLNPECILSAVYVKDTVVGSGGSTAQLYVGSVAAGLAHFIYICDYYGKEHKYGTGIVTVQPTATTTGVMTYTCKECNYVKTTVLPALGQEGCKHTNVTTLPAVGAGCETTGLTAGSQCMECGKVIVAQTVIPAFGHSYDEGIVIKPPTATQNGVKEFTCKICGNKKTTEIPATGTIVASGYCGKEAKWVINSDKVMIISGTGAIEYNTQFVQYEYSYNKVIIEEGITEIYPQIFQNNSNVEEIVLPDSIEKIGFAAFSYANKLVIDPELPSNLKVIGDHAFNGIAFKKGDLELPQGLETIGIGAFAYAKNLDGQLTIPSSVKTLGDYAFAGCSGLTGKLVIPGTIERVGSYAFNGCVGFSEIEIKEGVITIGDFGLALPDANTWWNSIVLPKSLETLEGNSFGDLCFGTVVVMNPNCNLGSGIIVMDKVVGKAGSTAETYAKMFECDFEYLCDYYGTPHNTEIIKGVAATCTEQGLTDGAACEFCGVVYEKQNVIPATGHEFNKWTVVTPADFGQVGIERQYCVNECGQYNEREITIVDSGKCGENTTWEIDFNKVLTIKGFGVIGYNTGFSKYQSVYEKVIVEEGITELCYGCFERSTAVKEIVLPDSLEVIGEYAIAYSWVEKLELPKNLKIIKNYGLYGSFIGETIVVPKSVECIEDDAFNAEAIRFIVIPNKDCKVGTIFTNSTAVTIVGHKGSEAEVFANSRWNAEFMTLCDYYGTPHNTKIIKGVAATCTETGLTDGAVCEFCGVVYEKQNVIPATGHNYGSGVITKAPTATATGIMTYTCKSCGGTKTEVIPATGSSTCKHTNTQILKAVAATCTTAGKTEGIKCITCNKIIVEQRVISALGHNFDAGVVTKQPTETTAGERTFTCQTCKATQVVEIPPLGDNSCKHEFLEIVPGYDATCTEDGLSDGVKCGNCYFIIEDQEVIKSPGHSWDEWFEEDSDCNGTTFMRMCENCGEEQTKFEKGKGHTYKTFTKVITRATQKAAGKQGTYKYCANCQDKSDAKLTSTAVIKKIAPVKMSATDMAYSGKSRIPTLTVKDSAGKKLKKGTDYKVTIKNSKGKVVTAPKSIGKYKITVTFLGKYKGYAYKNYNINPKGTTLGTLKAGKKQITVKWTKKTVQVTGYQIRYSTKQSMTGSKTITISKTKTTSRVIKSLKAKKKYYVQVRTYKTVNGKKFYSTWSAKKSIKTK